jgi:hypothetical protein
MNHNQAIENKSPMRYVLGELDGADRDAFEDHLADCSNCMEEVWTATQFAANAKEVFRAEAAKPRAARAPAWQWWRPFPAFAFSAAMNVALAAFLAYNVFHIDAGLRAELAEFTQPGVIQVAQVHGVVRGAAEAPVIATGRLLVLSFDSPHRYSRYFYSVADTSGRVVLSGESAGTASDVLNVRIPAGRLAPGQYRASASGVEGAQRDELGNCLIQVAQR